MRIPNEKDVNEILKISLSYKISMERYDNCSFLTVLIVPALSDNMKETYFYVIGIKVTELSSLCSVLSNSLFLWLVKKIVPNINDSEFCGSRSRLTPSNLPT